jgi:hypothetical protein
MPEGKGFRAKDAKKKGRREGKGLGPGLRRGTRIEKFTREVG